MHERDTELAAIDRVLAAGDYHHHIGLNTFRAPGLYHAAIKYPTRAALARAVRRVLDRGYAVSHGSDHGANEAVYLADPDGNGLELYWDRPKESWPRDENGAVRMFTAPLDVPDLLAELA